MALRRRSGMNDLQKMALEKAIDEQFAERMDWINEAIFKGCLDTDSAEKIYTQMIVPINRLGHWPSICWKKSGFGCRIARMRLGSGFFPL